MKTPKRREKCVEKIMILQETVALREVLSALVPMNFDQRCRLLRWVCDRTSIDPTKLSL